jgi:phosphate transport system substrate-binding protein
MNDEGLARASAAGGPVLHVPLVMGGVVPIYKLDSVDQPLRFTGPVLADIFLGKITKWNDAVLSKLNPGVNLPDLQIVPVHRADGSGTTYIFTDYLSKVSPEGWGKGPGKGMEVKWPDAGVGATKSDGMAGQVSRTNGSIGYVELLYAMRNKTKFGLVQNREGEFIEASLESVTAAAGEALVQIPDDLRFSITDAKGKASYPISGTTWAVVYIKQPPEKAKALADFFEWLTSAGNGQALVKELHYASLPSNLTENVKKKLQQLRGEAK